MKKLYIPSKLNSPEVSFDAESGELLISGQSILPEVQDFYTPVLKWLEDYAKEKPEEVTFRFHLNYYNLASAKRFMFIIFLLSKMRMNGSKVDIVWRFFKDDEFMKEFGEDLADNFDVPLNLVASPRYVSALDLAS